MSPIKDWPHAPIHRINSDGIYMVTGATPAQRTCLSNSREVGDA
jgi:hypothetical protein